VGRSNRALANQLFCSASANRCRISIGSIVKIVAAEHLDEFGALLQGMERQSPLELGEQHAKAGAIARRVDQNIVLHVRHLSRRQWRQNAMLEMGPSLRR